MPLPDLAHFTLERFQAAQSRIAALAVRTPLFRLDGDAASGPIYLKLELLQPVGSFKIRCGANALIRRGNPSGKGLSTASAGNFAQGLAYAGRALGIPIRTYVPDTAAASKVDAMQRLGAEVVHVSYEDWWAMMAEPTDDPSFIHPVADADVLIGNGTIALEILQDLPEVACVLAPYGGGGLSTGIALGLRAAGSDAQVIASETEAGAPLAAALAAGTPVTIDFNAKTFITGMGGPRVLDQIWPLTRQVITATEQVTLEETAAALRLMVDRHHIIAEGAGAVPVAAALKRQSAGPTVCIVSGGHLDTHHLMSILQGKTP